MKVGATSPPILYVDDDDDTRELAQIALHAFGYTILTVGDGRAALEHLRSGAFDVAVIDLGLPGFDGLALARQTHAEMGTGAPYLIAVTGYGTPQYGDASRAAGFSAFLVKPVPAEVLAEHIAKGRASRAQAQR